MSHFRVELDRIQTALRRTHGSDCTRRRAAQDVETRRRVLNRVPVGHPNLLTALDSPKQCVGVLQIELSESILAAVAFFHAAAQDVSHQLLPVAYTEHGDAAVK